jgi:hypothetical protein
LDATKAALVAQNKCAHFLKWLHLQVITYKFLSRSLKVHVNTAKQMLWNYVQTKQGTCKGVVYLVSGQVGKLAFVSSLHRI